MFLDSKRRFINQHSRLFCKEEMHMLLNELMKSPGQLTTAQLGFNAGEVRLGTNELRL